MKADALLPDAMGTIHVEFLDKRGERRDALLVTDDDLRPGDEVAVVRGCHFRVRRAVPGDRVLGKATETTQYDDGSVVVRDEADAVQGP